MKNVILPPGPERTLAFYLAMEEYVAGMSSDDVFFVWRVSPTVIIGRNQDIEAEVNLEYCRKNAVNVVRRKSGGGCVYSDRGNIMISCVYRRGEVADVFDRYLMTLTECLRSLGLQAERSGRNDVLVEGRKVSGNAFQQLPSRSIAHGTLLYDADLSALEKAIRPPVEKLERHGIASVRQRVANLNEYLTSPAASSVEALEEYLTGWFCDGEIVLDEKDIREIEARAECFEQFG